MTSNVNPLNINGTYPVAGQDNDSQGFRDNFTNIRTNFSYIKSEIEELQNNAVLKAPVGGASATENNLTGTMLVGATTASFTRTYFEHQSYTSNNISLLLANGDAHKITTTSSVTLGFGEWPMPGLLSTMVVWIHVSDIAHTITFPAAVSVGLASVNGVTGQVLTPPMIGDYVFEFSTVNGGTTVICSTLAAPLGDTSSLPGQINLLQSEYTTLNSNFNANVTILNHTVANVTILQGNVTGLESNVSTLQSNVSTLQSNVGTLTTGLSHALVNNAENILHGTTIAGSTGKVDDRGTTSGAISVNFNAGDFVRIIANGATSLTFTNWPAAGTFAKIRIWITITNVADTITLPSVVNVGTNKVTGLNTTTNILTPQIGNYVLEFSTINSGSAIMVQPIILP